MTGLVKPSRLGTYHRGQRLDVLFFGESPGRDEVAQGHAFVGPSGRLLRELLQAELPGKTVVLDNVCPENLDGAKPKPLKLKEYTEYREKRIKQYQPKVVCLLGRYAHNAFGILGSPVANSGQVKRLYDRPFVLSVHPAYALRDMSKLELFKPVFQAIRASLVPPRNRNMTELKSREEIHRVLDRLSMKPCAVDLETSSFDPAEGVILCAAVTHGNHTWWFGTHHADADHSCRAAVECENLLSAFWSRGPRICHNLKFELTWMRALDAEDPPAMYDTLQQAWLIDENLPKNLNWQVINVLRRKPYWLQVEAMSEGKSYAEVPLNVLGPYCANDTLCTWKLCEIQRRKLTVAQRRVADEMFTPLTCILADMKALGIKLDLDLLEKLREKHGRRHKRLIKTVQESFPNLNVASHPQMRELLYDTWNLPVLVHTKGKPGKKRLPSTAEEAINKLVKDSRVSPRRRKWLKTLLDARQAESLVKRLTAWMSHAVDGYLPCNFSLGVTTTGRLTSSNPNLMNLDRDGPQRSVLVSRHRGGKIVQLDFSQHELRILAVITEDPAFLRAFENGEDPHQLTCDGIRALGVDCDRPRGKNINFGVIFDITEHGLWDQFDIPEAQGKALIDAWYRLHPNTGARHDLLEKQMKERGWVEDVFGCRRHLENPKDGHQRRQAYNYEIQGAAVRICYLAMIEIDRWVRENDLRSRIIFHGHDSVALDSPAGEVKRVAENIARIATGLNLKPWTGKRLPVPIPLAVEVKIGDHL